MNINKHYELILKNYNLEYLHKKYMVFSILTVTLREGFYWLLLIFSEYVKKNESLVSKYATILVSILGIYIPVERQLINIRSTLIEKIKLYNNDYFNNRIINMSKKELLNFD